MQQIHGLFTLIFTDLKEDFSGVECSASEPEELVKDQYIASPKQHVT